MSQPEYSLRILFPALMICLVNLQLSRAEYIRPQLRQEVSQYGITWTFSEPALTGRFITGDWWVVGPVTVIKTDPAPGPLTVEDMTDLKLNQWGDTSLKVDSTMRNGSMIVLEAGRKWPGLI